MCEGLAELRTVVEEHDYAVASLQTVFQEAEDRIALLEAQTVPVTLLHLEAESDQQELESLCYGLDEYLESSEPYFHLMGCNKNQEDPLSFKPALLRLGPERGDTMVPEWSREEEVSSPGSPSKMEATRSRLKEEVVSPVGGLLVRSGPRRIANPTPESIRGVLGLNLDVVCLRGQKYVVNQDSFAIFQAHLAELGPQRLTVLSVLDGHGEMGHMVSSKLSQVLPGFVLQAVRKRSGRDGSLLEMREVFRSAFEMAHHELEAWSRASGIDLRRSGACAVVALRLPGGDNTLHCAWVGDSQVAVLDKAGQPQFVSREHDITGEEGKRVAAAGGVIIDKGPGIGGAPILRIYRHGDDGPGLAISRAFGDWSASDLGVTWEPEYDQTSLESGFTVVLGSDGLWDCLAASELESFRPDQRSNQSWADALTKVALQRRVLDYHIPADDTTCMLWHVEE
mmetsp:Transcript_72497/g.172840  ORF Transcript_72497/g.172840 Transcript_72497/m.172840 type:complete len:453 (+) Transcript_72497:102-1460(+)